MPGGKNEKKAATDDIPCFNEIILRRALTAYESYSAELKTRCCPDVIVNLKNCIEDNLTLTKV